MGIFAGIYRARIWDLTLSGSGPVGAGLTGNDGQSMEMLFEIRA